MKNQEFPLFRSHLDLAHHYWKRSIGENDWAIDATCGNGHDSKVLATLLQTGGGLIAIDIQEKAIEQTGKALEGQQADKIHLFHQSHVLFPSLAYIHPIKVIVYNLGYLPGGDKDLTTQTESTLTSLDEALNLLALSGILSITCYPGHQEGAKEQEAILKKLSQLNPADWNVCHHTFCNRRVSPSLILVQKQVS